MDVEILYQGASLTLLLVTNTQEEQHSQDTGDVELGSGELDLSDYLLARMESDTDSLSHLANPDPISPSSEESYMDCSSTSTASEST